MKLGTHVHVSKSMQQILTLEKLRPLNVWYFSLVKELTQLVIFSTNMNFILNLLFVSDTKIHTTPPPPPSLAPLELPGSNAVKQTKPQGEEQRAQSHI